MKIISATETAIQNGFFLKVESSDLKTGKVYTSELIVVDDYAAIILLSTLEKKATAAPAKK